MVEVPTPGQLRKARLLSLLLPEAERRELERRHGSDVRPALLSAVVGLFELVLGVAVYALAHPGFGGSIGWVVWHLNPVAWIGLLMIVTALTRVVNFFANHDATGEPLVWMALRAAQLRQRAGEGRRLRETYGPERADRVVVDGDGTLVLLASRAKPDWDEYRTVRIDDEFFTIDEVSERQHGSYRAVAYILREVRENEPLRGIVHTDARLPADWRRGC